MGDFVVTLKAIGGHGCQREIPAGEKVGLCDNANSCPDCITREYVDKLKAAGVSIAHALYIHWPGSDAIVENLMDGVRKSSFADAKPKAE